MKKLADGGVMCPVPDPHKYPGEEYNAAFLSYVDRAINELPDQNQPVMFTRRGPAAVNRSRAPVG